LLEDENEHIAEAFLKANPEFVLVPANSILAQQQINLDTGNYLKLLPHLHQTDGFFAAVFEKAAAVKPGLDNAGEKIEALTSLDAVTDEATDEAADDAAIKAERKKASISKSKSITKAASKAPAKNAAAKKPKA
jgi:16S rRNA (cytosine967-C5)-methyltransferase